jgi:DNA invertase Pin-like site-specific DNA recombinase
MMSRMRVSDIEPVALADDRAEHALRDLLDAARRTDEQLSYGAFALNHTQREQLRALLADLRGHGERAIDVTTRPRIARLRGRRGWRFGRDRAGRIQTPWGEQLSRRWHGALLEWAIDMEDAARAGDRARVLGLILGRVAHAHEQARLRQRAADDARSEVLELCVAALKVPEVSLALLARELGIARQTLHERLTRMQRDGPLDVAARWHELKHTAR